MVEHTGQRSARGVAASDFIRRSEGKLRDFYRIGKVLGTGAFGEVRMCVDRESGA